MGFLDWLRNEEDPEPTPTAPTKMTAPASPATASTGNEQAANKQTTDAPAGCESARPRGSFAVLDVETTGLKPHYDRVIELAIIDVSPDGEVVDEWVSRFNPEGPVGATHIHGIRQEDVDAAPLFHERAAEIVSRLAGRVIVAHNAAFDRSMVDAEFSSAGWDLPATEWFCTYENSRIVFPELPRRTLSECCTAAEVRLRDAHSAAGDARATAELMAKYLEHPRLARSVDARMRDAVDLIWPTAPARPPLTIAERPVRTAAPAFRRPKKKVEAPLLERIANVTASDIANVSGVQRAVAYVELLLDCLEDGEITDDEAIALDEVRQSLGMSVDDVDTVHLAVLHTASRIALDDGVLSRAEKFELDSLAEALLTAPGAVTRSLAEAKRAREAKLGEDAPPLPADWALGEPLRVGDGVVLTGACGGMRDELETRASDAGIRVMSSISGKTAMLVSDGSFSGGKAKKAEQLGTRIVSPADFSTLLDHVQPAA